MMTDAERKGNRMGWEDAERYAKGTRADRHQIRRRLAKVNGSDFWLAYRRMFTDRALAFSNAIDEGRLPRTCNPHKLANVAFRIAY